MSAESLLVSAVVDEGAQAVRRVYAEGLTAASFAVYDEEWAWVERRLARKRPVNLRALKERFPDFEYERSRGESVQDLAQELKREVALAELNEVVREMSAATKDDVLEVMAAAKERITAVTRAHSPMSDVDLDDWRPVVEEMRHGQILARQGKSLGIRTYVPHIDAYMGGLMPGQFVMVSGRTGSAKSFWLMLLAWVARKQGLNVGLFSPEFNRHEVTCRYHTIASADKSVQEAVGIERSFRNRDLMQRIPSFSLKSYARFCEYVAGIPGSIHLLCGQGERDQMSVGYVEDRLVEHELDLVLVDPIYLLKPVRLHREGNPYQEVAWIGESLHRLGEQYDVPIVFTNQAHLDGNRSDAPGMKESYGAKSLLHISDWVLGVQHMSEEHTLIVKASKGRFGESFRFTARFVANTGYFRVETPLPASMTKSSHDDEMSEDVVLTADNVRRTGGRKTRRKQRTKEAT